MSKEKRRVPKLRFPGFTEDWEQREFSDIFAEVKSGLSRMLSNDDIGLPVVRANNINDGQLNLVDDIKYWYKNDPQGANTNNYLIEQGDILINFINSEAKMGTAAYVTRRPERDTIYTTNILRCKVNDEYNPYFIYSLTFLNSYKNYIASITKPAVNQASFTTVDFKKYSIKIPTVKEQNQIADLIETFNKLITLHQRKLDNLKLKKKALLQKLFPKNGERYPELRFPEFTDAWEQRKLGDLMEVTSVKRIHQADWTDSGVRFFRARDIVSSMNNEEVDNPVFISEDKYEEYSRISGKVIAGDLLVTGVGTIGIPYLIKDTTPLYFKDGNIIWFKNNNILNGKYFYYCFQNNHIQSQIYSASGKGTVGTYTIENGKKTSISYPSLKEQVKIGKLLDTMTIMITLHQRKLDHLQLQKKALLQQMFV